VGNELFKKTKTETGYSTHNLNPLTGKNSWKIKIYFVEEISDWRNTSSR